MIIRYKNKCQPRINVTGRASKTINISTVVARDGSSNNFNKFEATELQPAPSLRSG
jgi:hypothetical protein